MQIDSMNTPLKRVTRQEAENVAGGEVLAADADHSFHVPVRSGRSDREVLASLLDGAAAWMIAR